MSTPDLIFKVDFPPTDLSSNARVHWSVKARAAAMYKEVCYYLALSARNRWELATGYKWEPIEKAVVSLVFLVADKRERDVDNLVAMAKPLLDAIQCPRSSKEYGARLIVADDAQHMELTCRVEQAAKFGVSVTIRESGSYGGRDEHQTTPHLPAVLRTP